MLQFFTPGILEYYFFVHRAYLCLLLTLSHKALKYFISSVLSFAVIEVTHTHIYICIDGFRFVNMLMFYGVGSSNGVKYYRKRNLG